uniref:ANK_REP_REGION domain-containing protein n=1 Tax=Parastrongyloides trichosuri TaxID=131310 RepID=A0A0N4ZWX3_PARTI
MKNIFGSKINFNEDNQKAIYTLVGMNNCGELINWLRYALRSGDYSFIDEYIEEKLPKYMYNGGKGKIFHISDLVKIRQVQRLNQQQNNTKGGGLPKIDSKEIDDLNQLGQNQNNIRKALKMIDGGKGNVKHREIIWKLEERGFIGESIIGVCLLKGSPLHCILARRIIKKFPKLVNDFMISEEYYGLSPLHQSIINEDLDMMYFLLKNGADITQRCYGSFFSTYDQRNTRWDTTDYEHVEMSINTNYFGKTYMGELPLSFASSSNNLDSIRLLRGFKADVTLKDYNGNTAMHMAVIHENHDALHLLYELGGKLSSHNRLNLTPLTLAAKLGKKKAFEEILNLERSLIWKHGNYNSFSYPIAKIDTIDQDTGVINYESALSLIVYGDSQEHLEMLDGLLEELLKAKWNLFAKKKLLTSFIFYVIYYITFAIAFSIRPTKKITTNLTGSEVPIFYNEYNSNCFLTIYNFKNIEECIRFITELMVSVMAFIQIIIEIFDIRHLGYQRWWNIYRAFPAKLLYKLSLVLVMLMIILRYLCYFDNNIMMFENFLAIICIMMTTIHFLFYCRAIKYIGAFVIIIYDIIAKDMIIFIIIYSIFLIGFSQGFYILFLSCSHHTLELNQTSMTCENIKKSLYNISEQKSKKNENEFQNKICEPHESLLRMFIMTLGEFQDIYRNINNCPDRALSIAGKVLFLIFQLIVVLVLFNVLIAMMTRTYEKISSTNNEYKRQLAKVILTTEVSMSAQERRIAMLKYSKPIDVNRRKRGFIMNVNIYSDEGSSKKDSQCYRIALQRRMKLIQKLREN